MARMRLAKPGLDRWRARARWGVAGAAAVTALLAAAGPAAAAGGTDVSVSAAGGLTSAGQVVVSGVYVCDPAVAAYNELTVIVQQGKITGGTADRVACTGEAEGWQEVVTPPLASQNFGAGPAHVEVVLWTQGAGAQTSQAVNVS